MLTVTWQLKPLIVTLHLLFGLATLSMLWWLLCLNLFAHRAATSASAERWCSGLALAYAVAHTAAVAYIVALITATASRSRWVVGPAATTPPSRARIFRSASASGGRRRTSGCLRALARAGINYEGGVLDHPARVAIHFMHRLGALFASVALVSSPPSPS